MRAPTLPLTRDLVLVGGGHAHALVLRMWAMDPLPGVRVTLINPGPSAPYSGMLPGFVAGHYPRSALDIDLVKLAQFAGARIVLGPAEGIDLGARQIHVAKRAPIGFDVAALDVGINSAMPALPGFAEHAIPAKPLASFASAWDRLREGTGPVRTVVIGGGVAGAELAAAQAHALRQSGREASVTVIDRGTALSALSPRAAARLRAALAALGVTLIERAEITRITAASVALADGRCLPADFVTGAARAQPYGWLAESGLAHEDGFVTVGPTLQSSDADVFASGDCAHLSHAPRPKAGVFAVREAPVLLHNLRSRLMGKGRMRRYHPQRDYLKLISLGDRSALADRFGLAPSGPLMWRWKDHIDQRFMQKFRDLPQMRPPALPAHHAAGMVETLGDKPMCGGCGAKVGQEALGAALSRLPAHRRTDITPLPGDDAALLQTGGARQVLSTDHLRAVVADPEIMARIAAVHALGDIWAMGAEPQAAVSNITLPRMSEALAERSLTEILTAAAGIMQAAGAEIVGGHSSMGDELSIGFSITGLCEAPPITLSGARAGDALILTKPIGTGVLMAAAMDGSARGDWITAALAQMSSPQIAAAKVLRGAHAMTDVTGFGLAGHLRNICTASGLGAELWLEEIPHLDGACELAASGVRSTLFSRNRFAIPGLPQSAKADLLFDPQTAGGLLAAVPDGPATQAVLAAVGVKARIIGKVLSTPNEALIGQIVIR